MNSGSIYNSFLLLSPLWFCIIPLSSPSDFCPYSFYSHPPNNVSSHPQVISAFISKIIFSFIFKRFLLSCPTDFFSLVQNISNLIFNRYLALSINDLNLYLQLMSALVSKIYSVSTPLV